MKTVRVSLTLFLKFLEPGFPRRVAAPAAPFSDARRHTMHNVTTSHHASEQRSFSFAAQKQLRYSARKYEINGKELVIVVSNSLSVERRRHRPLQAIFLMRPRAPHPLAAEALSHAHQCRETP